MLTAMTLTGFATLSLGRIAASSPATNRPNVLVIITDQQSATMLSCAGNPYVKTPAIDSLANAGVRFERAYCANPVCAPSRFTMMTGVLPSRIGMESNDEITNPVAPKILRQSLGQVFRAAGYETAYGGKTHLPGESRDLKPYGFDPITRDERDGLADACIDFLKRPHERPFLLVASFINPHDICYLAIDAFAHAAQRPLAFPTSIRERVTLADALRLPQGISREDFFRRVCPPLPDNFAIPQDEPSALRQTDWREFRAYVQAHWTDEDWRLHRWAYARLTERADAEIGKVLAAFRQGGLEANTLVVFTSDHGDMDAAHHLEHKSMPYEEATRVPLIVSWKGVTPAGRVDKTHLISAGLELVPTLCDFAGIATPPDLHGASIKPLALGKSPSWQNCVVAENERSRILWTEQFMYAVYDRGAPREFLVDLKNDPGELRNLAVDSKHRSVLARHRALLQRWYKNHGENLNPKYIVPAVD